MSNRLSDAMSKLNVDSARNSLVRPSAAGKRQSGLDPSTINAMFPDAAAAIATEKAKFTQQTGNVPASNRNSTVAGPADGTESNTQNPASPWVPSGDASAGQSKPPASLPPMGQFVQPQSASGLRSPRPPQLASNSNIQSTTLTATDSTHGDLPLLSPYAAGSGNWASMVNTPMVPNFNTTNPNNQADMVANATAMKLAALSTVNNRFALDDVRKYRKSKNEGQGMGQHPPGLHGSHQGMNMPSANVVMINEHGQVVSRDQMLALQAQQSMGTFGGQRSRPTSPGLPMQQGFPGGGVPFASPRNNGFLSAYDGAQMMNNSIAQVNLGQLGIPFGGEGYHSDHSEMTRGRSPRGRRGNSKPPEDPTDPSLLQDIPAWLRSLRLHKYTDNLKDMKWSDLVELDDKALEERGVNALGARRKMLKVFEQVKGSYHHRHTHSPC
jgi:hypothetical protein